MTPSTATQPAKLYQLADEYTFLAHRYLSLMEEIEEAEGVITPEQEQALAEITASLDGIMDGAEDKILSIARMIVQSEVEAAALDGEEKRIAAVAQGLAKRRKRIERTNDFFRRYILGNMERMNVDKLKDDQTAVSIRRSEAVEVLDQSRLPYEYLRRATVELSTVDPIKRDNLMAYLTGIEIPYSAEPDKVGIKAAIKGGAEVPGAEIKSNRSLRIS